MALDEELLLKTLKDLVKDDLEEFQWHLKIHHKDISNSEMENADRIKTVDIMVEHFGLEEAVKIMLEILRKMNKNNLANQLENNHKQATDISTARPPRGTSSTSFSVISTNTALNNRNDFQKYSHQLTLDLNTAYKHLRLSDSNRVVSYTYTVQSYPDHPDRFDYYHQVLCRESVTGRGYWELEWSGDCVYISVSYKSIRRKGSGDDCVFGQSAKSWSLICYPDRYFFMHNDTWTNLSVKSVSSRIGVFVDQSAGTLSFYSVSDAMSLIHTVQTTFTQPLYPGFYLDYKSSVKLC
uniref:B30.2/SPRY domain-containing protein n=1 Tax=Cyprinus carpio carpio TaxID=630221 RepID=A0A8C1AXN3_CYPCA